MFIKTKYIDIFMTKQKEDEKEEKEKTMIQLNKSTVKKIDDFEIIIKERGKLQFKVSNDLILNMVFDCVDENKLNEKLKTLKETMSN